MDKLWRDAAAAVADVPDGATIMVGGFSAPGIPRTLVRALAEQGARDLTLIANSAAGTGEPRSWARSSREARCARRS